MKTAAHDRETELHVVHGFSMWLTSTLPGQTEESREFSDQLLHALQIYGWELERLIDSELATQDWFTLVATTAILARMLQDEFIEANPGLAAYPPSEEPKTVAEMTACLLSDALAQFEASQKEMAECFEKPMVPTVLNEFMQSVFASQPNRPLA